VRGELERQRRGAAEHPGNHPAEQYAGGKRGDAHDLDDDYGDDFDDLHGRQLLGLGSERNEHRRSELGRSERGLVGGHGE
jgi:hypothetical protein